METTQLPASGMDRATTAAIRLAQTMARKLPPHIDGEVLKNEAMFGVWFAGQRFQPERGASFPSWAISVVQSRLLEEIRRQTPWTRRQRQFRKENFATWSGAGRLDAHPSEANGTRLGSG